MRVSACVCVCVISSPGAGHPEVILKTPGRAILMRQGAS